MTWFLLWLLSHLHYTVLDCGAFMPHVLHQPGCPYKF